MFDKSKYDIDYMKKNITRKQIPFNMKNPEDAKMKKWLESRQEGITAYIKGLILEDMNHSENPDPRLTL